MVWGLGGDLDRHLTAFKHGASAASEPDSLLREVARAPAIEPPRFGPGDHIGPYEVRAFLGAGGMGQVYRAWDPRLGRDVAVKVMITGERVSAERARRFEQEARAIGALDHPNILAIHGAGTHDETPYLVFALLEGETLREHLAAAAPSARDAAGKALQIARGLAAAHERGIVHRDLKPENLFVTRDDVVKLLDFGLAKLPADQVGARTTTDEGTVLGTAPYMSPEQVRGEPADRRSDVFALGAIMYEMLTGTRVFARSSGADTMVAILTEQPPRIPRIPLPLQRIVRRCLEKRAEDRFQSADDVVAQLERVSWTGGSALRRGAAVLAVAVAAATIAVWATRGEHRDTARARPVFETFLDGRVALALTLDGDGFSIVQRALRTGDGTLVLAGHTAKSITLGDVEVRPPNVSRNGFVVAVSPAGHVRWHRIISGTDDTQVISIASGGGTLVVVGIYRGLGTLSDGVGLPMTHHESDRDCFIAAYRERDGVALWARSCGVSKFGQPRTVIADREGNLYMAGEYMGTATFGGNVVHGTSGDGRGMFVASYRPDGALRWVSAASDATGKATRCCGLAIRAGGELWFAGSTAGRMRLGDTDILADQEGDAMIGVLDAATGTLRRLRMITGSGAQGLSSVAVGPRDEVVVAGTFMGTTELIAGASITAGGEADAYLVLLDPVDGKPLRAWTGTGAGYDGLHDLRFGPRGIVAAGRFEGRFRFGEHELESRGSTDGFVVEIDPAGPVRSLLGFGGPSQDGARAIDVDRDGTIRIAGKVRRDAEIAGRRLHTRGVVNGFVVELRPAN